MPTPIPPKWLALAADLLEMAADKFANHGCNDLDIPDGWTEADVSEFGRAYEEWNSDGRDFDPEIADQMPPDWLAMRFLAERLRAAAGRED